MHKKYNQCISEMKPTTAINQSISDCKESIYKILTPGLRLSLWYQKKQKKSCYFVILSSCHLIPVQQHPPAPTPLPILWDFSARFHR